MDDNNNLHQHLAKQAQSQNSSVQNRDTDGEKPANEPQAAKRKGNKPDFYIQLVTQEGDTTYYEDIGATWDTKKDGYSKGKLGDKHIIIQTREAREKAIANVRTRKQDKGVASDHSPTQSL